ncbi:MAG: hypothetical protein IT320_10385 [Anaerolineae bacterium]|nr:hypothetical protein [Anaerolineae bacterium]
MLISIGAALNGLFLPPALVAEISLVPLVEFIVGVMWAVIFAYIALQLWRRKPRAPRFLGWALVAWIGYSVFRLSVFARADYDRQRLPFLWVAGLVGCVVIGIFLLRPGRTGAAHMETNDHEQRED